MAVVLVIGASRGIGLETVKRLLETGHAVRALARSAQSIATDHPHLTKISGEALDPATVSSAVEGAEAVILTLGAPKGPDAVLTGTTLFSRATRLLIDIMREKGVRRLVAVTGLGAGDSRGYGGFLHNAAFFLVLKRIYDDKDIQEQMIRSSGLEWTIVRPGLLTSGPATGRAVALTEAKDWRGGSISRPDVAEFLARETFERRFVGKTPVLVQ